MPLVLRHVKGSKGRGLRLAVFAAAAMLSANAAGADEMQTPRVILSPVNWAEAALSLADHGIDPLAAEFARLNAQTEKRFPGIATSTVPVLLPVDVDSYRKDVVAGTIEAETSDKYFGPFHPSKLFLPGPAGYTATFFLKHGDGGFDFAYPKPIAIEITGGAFVYDLADPKHQEVFPPPKDLAVRFPGMQRILRESHARYTFERFGVPYVVSVQCYDRPRSSRYLSCKEADPAVVKFLNLLNTAGGTPAYIPDT